MKENYIAEFQFQSAMRKAQRPPFNWFGVFAIVVSTLAVLLRLFGFGILPIFIAWTVYFYLDRYNRRKVEERILNVRIKYGRVKK